MSTPPQESTSPLSGILTVWLCAATSLGCPAAQVRPAPPEPAACPEEARRVMFEELKLHRGGRYLALIDINQPGVIQDDGTYRDGPLVGRVRHIETSSPGLPGGTLLFGQLWTGPGIKNRMGEESVIGRYTEAVLPDGRKVPVCIVLGGPEGRWYKEPGSTADVAVLPRELPVSAVWDWP